MSDDDDFMSPDVKENEAPFRMSHSAPSMPGMLIHNEKENKDSQRDRTLSHNHIISGSFEARHREPDVIHYPLSAGMPVVLTDAYSSSHGR